MLGGWVAKSISTNCYRTKETVKVGKCFGVVVGFFREVGWGKLESNGK